MKANAFDANEWSDESDPAFQSLVKRLDQLWDRSPRSTAQIAGGLLSRGTPIDKYVIERCIGHGSFGIVYLARDLELSRDVALKFPRLEVLIDDEKRNRFHREATAASALDHPGVVPTYEAKLEGPLPYIASAYCPGPDLNAWLTAQTANVGARDAAAFVAELADALHFAHDRGVIHRDIKPSNVLLVQKATPAAADAGLGNYVPRLTDFGLAKLCEADVDATQASLLLGTPIYMAPEQFGRCREAVGPGADVYSLGVILFQLMARRPPFVGESYYKVLQQISETEPPRLSTLRPDVPRDLEVVCQKCLNKNPHERYVTAAELAADLRRHLENRPIHARSASITQRVRKWTKRHPTLLKAGAVFGTLLTVVLGASSALVRHSDSQAALAMDHSADLLYVTDMTLAYRSWEKGWSDDVQQVLNRHVPGQGQVDRRGLEWHLLHDLVQPPTSKIFLGHDGAVNEIAVFPDRRRIASVGDDGTLRIWDIHAGKQLRSLPLAREPLSAVAVSPDARYLAAGGKSLFLVDLEGSDEPKVLLQTKNTIESICFRSDGQSLAAGARYSEIYLLRLDGEVIRRIPCNSRVRTLEFLPDSQEFVLPNRSDGVSFVCAIQGWDEDLLRLQREYAYTEEGYRQAVSIARASPCETFLAVADEYYPKVLLFNRVTGVVTAETVVARDNATDMDYSPDGSSIAVAYRNGEVHRYHVHGQEDGDVSFDDRPQVIKAHKSEVQCLRYLDEETLITCGADGQVIAWQLEKSNGEAKLNLDDESRPMGFELSSDGSVLFCRNSQGLLSADLATGTTVTSLVPEIAHVVDTSPDGKQVAARFGLGSEIAILNEGVEIVRSVTFPDRPESIAYSPTGEEWACVGNVYLQVHSTHDGAALFQFPLEGRGWAVEYSNDGRTIAYAETVGGIGILDVASRQLQRQLPAASIVGAIQFSPGDSHLATGHEDSCIRIWDVATGELQTVLIGHERPIRDVQFSPDGRTLLSASLDRTIRVWSVVHGCSFGVLHRGSVGESRLSMSADGSRLAAYICGKDCRPVVLLNGLIHDGRPPGFRP